MTAVEYAKFESDYAAGMKRLDAERLDAGEEQGFSWRPCGICGSKLGGNRTNCHLGAYRGEVQACTDCVLYGTYGHLDDVTE